MQSFFQRENKNVLRPRRKANMNVAIITNGDCCGTGKTFSLALSKYTSHNIRFVSCANKRVDYAKAIKNADIIWVGGDTPIEIRSNKFIMYEFRGIRKIEKPSGHFVKRGVKIMHTPYGSHFRRPIEGFVKSYGTVPLQRFTSNANLIAPITPELNYPENHGIYFPHAYDVSSAKNTWKPSKKITIGAYLAQLDCKNVNTVLRPAVEILKGMGITIDLKVGNRMPHKEFVKMVSECTLYFDQVNPCGIYAYAGVEAMSHGIPVISSINDVAIKQASPIENYGSPCLRAYDVQSLVNLLVSISNDEIDLERVSLESRQYAERVHSYQSIAKYFNNVIENYL